MDELKQAAALLGKKGGEAKVSKGFAKMGKLRRKQIAQAAIKKRWASERAKRKDSAA